MRIPDAAWRQAYPVEVDNIRAAIDWALVPAGDAHTSIQLVVVPLPMWTNAGLYAEALARQRQRYWPAPRAACRRRCVRARGMVWVS